ncbi:unnamed protein product, partial [marine sediment metagenome]
GRNRASGIPPANQHIREWLRKAEEIVKTRRGVWGDSPSSGEMSVQIIMGRRVKSDGI